MARHPLPLGSPGNVTVKRAPSGAWIARCRFRDHGGTTRQLKAHGATQTAARTGLNDDIRERQRGRGGAVAGELTPASTFADAAVLYLAKVNRKRGDSTHALYEYHLQRTVLPALGALRVRECTVARLEAFLEALEPRYATSTRRTLRATVSGVLQVAVLHEVLPANPVRELDRIEQPKGQRKKQPRGLTLDERRAFLGWLDGSSEDPES